MKIDGNGQNSPLAPLGPGTTESARVGQGGKATDAGGSGSNDSVQLSSDAQFADRLRQALNMSSAIRQDKVDEAKRKLDAGEIGQDPAALASRMIDQMLEG